MTFQDAVKFLKSQNTLRITVSGDIGSGKSTFSKKLAQKLEIKRISVGEMIREEATNRNMTLLEFSELQIKDDTIDKALDAKQTEISKKLKKGVFEGRTAWHFVYEPTVTIFLAIDPKQGALRILEDSNINRDKFSSLDDVISKNKTRKQSEITRYQNYYNIDVYDLDNYDIVIDTTSISIEKVFEKAMIAISNHIKLAKKT